MNNSAIGGVAMSVGLAVVIALSAVLYAGFAVLLFVGASGKRLYKHKRRANRWKDK